MIKKFLLKYAFWLAISITLNTVLIWQTFTTTLVEDNPLIILILCYVAAVGNLIGLIIHARMWWKANTAKRDKEGVV